MRRNVFVALLSIIVVATVSVSAKADDAAATFKAKCSVCHGADGKGATPSGKKLGARDFQSPDVVKMSDADLIAITTNGKHKMPAYKGKLSDDQIKALVAYCRTLGK